jgi:hypothetical protein
LLAALDTGALRISHKAPSLADEGSEFTSVKTSTVLATAAFWLFGTALLGIIGFSRRKAI